MGHENEDYQDGFQTSALEIQMIGRTLGRTSFDVL